MTKSAVERNLDNIPDELKELDQWLVCNKVKVPINAKTGGPGSTTNPETWSSFKKAQVAVESGKYKLVGFVLTEDGSYVTIDLDHVINLETGEILPWAQAIIDQMDSYTEVSQSGTGVHIIIRGKKPSGKCRRDQVEIYDSKRYFALTGNILSDRSTIEDRQEQLDSLYAETFGKSEAVPSGKPASDLALHQNANPPADKLKKMLKDDVFLETWEYGRTDLADTSLSGHDLSLANYAARDGWSDQEIADLIIAFRRKNGSEKDLKKALRLDYISGVIEKASHGGALELLPFGVREVIQYGEQEAEYTIVTQSGQHIDMGETSAFLSPRRARQRLLERGYFLSPKAVKYWSQVIKALMPFRIEALPTRIEDTEDWLRQYLASMNEILLIDPDDPDLPGTISKALTVWSANAVMRDKQGRIYFSLSRAINHARRIFGPSFSMETLALRLKKMGFKKAGVQSDYSGGKRSQVRMWMSDVGYLTPIVEDVETPAVASNQPEAEGNFSSLREDEQDMRVLEKELSEEEQAPNRIDGVIRVRKDEY